MINGKIMCFLMRFIVGHGFDDAFLMVLSVERAVLFWFMEFMVFYDWTSLDLMERGGTMEDCPFFRFSNLRDL